MKFHPIRFVLAWHAMPLLLACLAVRCPAQVVIQPPGVRVVLAGPGITVNTNGFTRTISAPGAAGDITGVTSNDGSIVVTSGAGPAPDLSLPSVLPARNGALLTDLNASSISTGTVATARLGTGTANTNTFLRGNSTWADLSDIFLTLSGPEGRTVEWTDDGVVYDLGDTSPSYLGVWRRGNGQMAMGVDTDINETPYLWMESQEGFAFLSLRTNDTVWLADDLPGTTLIKLRASLTAADLLTGTIPDARFPATLPAVSGANLTNLDATDLTGTISRARLPTSHTTPFVSWASTDCNFFTTAGVWWYPYENSSIDFGAAGLRAAASDDQLGTLRTRWTRVPHEASAFKEVGAIVLTFAVSSTAGVTECRGLRLMGRNLKTDTPTTLYTDTSTRDGHASSAGALVTFSIDRSAFASSTLYTDIQAEVDVSCEDGEVFALESISVRFE